LIACIVPPCHWLPEKEPQNIEQGISNAEGECQTSSFEIPCLFDIRQSLASGYSRTSTIWLPECHWLASVFLELPLLFLSD
jgi:hypothetical protein